MPKFKRSCHNPFHDDWSNDETGRIFHLKSHGFVSVAVGLKMFLEAETGKKNYRSIDYLCKTCLKMCVSKRKVTKFFAQADFELIKESVQKQVRNLVH